MLSDRGYVIAEEDAEKTFDSFQQIWKQYKNREAFKIFVQHRDNQTDSILCSFPDEDKLGVPTIKKVCQKMEELEVNRGIIIMKEDVTAFARRALDRVNASFHLETFKQSELLINITQHTLVPTHKILDEKEKRELIQKYSLEESQLPRIQKADPIARYFGATKGQVFKITRISETAGRYVTYRIVT